MPRYSVDNKVVVKNTLFLYVRMLLIMFVSLYTSRIVLGTLGVEDYGIYNVVGGIVAIFGFLNAAMSTSTQRYITYALGKGDFESLQSIFSNCIFTHALISFIIIILAETLGLWLLYNKLIIPEDRLVAAFWVFQCSIVSTVVMIMSIPYNADIIAHERMSAFAYISVVEVVLKLLVVYLLIVGDFDKLILYAVFQLLIQCLIRCIYGRYCNKNFAESKIKWQWDYKLFKEMLSFASWSLFGNIAYVAMNQGVNVLLNTFFGPVVNAARGIAVQVQGAAQQFSSSFQMAINPQITKTYAKGYNSEMFSLICISSKFSTFLLLMIILPIYANVDFILEKWLIEVPLNTAAFLKIGLLVSLVECISNPFMVAVSATGKIKKYQTIVGGCLILTLPVSYVFLRCGFSPKSVYWVQFVIFICAYFLRLLLIKGLINIDYRYFFKNVLLRIVLVTVLSIIPFSFQTTENWSEFFLCLCMCLIDVIILILLIGLEKHELTFLKNIINEKILRRK